VIRVTTEHGKSVHLSEDEEPRTIWDERLTVCGRTVSAILLPKDPRLVNCKKCLLGRS